MLMSLKIDDISHYGALRLNTWLLFLITAHYVVIRVNVHKNSCYVTIRRDTSRILDAMSQYFLLRVNVSKNGCYVSIRRDTSHIYMLCLNTFRNVFMSLKIVSMSQYLVIRLRYYMLCLDTSRCVLCL